MRHIEVESKKDASMSQVEKRLQELGIVLPQPAPAIANYVAAVQTGNLVIISGQLCLGLDGKLSDTHKGKLGANITIPVGQEAATLCAVNLLAQLKGLIGDLDRVVRCVRLGGFINAVPDFSTLPAVMNGASDLIVNVLGDKGRHARSTIGVSVLPLDAAVEVEGLFEVI
jgi:enamine deaminase RidA (YjgF/YER057c/UK114 family)